MIKNEEIILFFNFVICNSYLKRFWWNIVKGFKGLNCSFSVWFVLQDNRFAVMMFKNILEILMCFLLFFSRFWDVKVVLKHDTFKLESKLCFVIQISVMDSQKKKLHIFHRLNCNSTLNFEIFKQIMLKFKIIMFFLKLWIFK